MDTLALHRQGRFLTAIERIGNKIPHPFLLFIYLIVLLLCTSALLSWLQISVKDPINGQMVYVNNLLSAQGIDWLLPNIVNNFSHFTPLGAILALVLGAGLAEQVGLLTAVMHKMAAGVNARYASYLVLFIAFFSHISSDAALVVMPPLGALMFIAVGRHPVAGLLAAIAGVAAGFTANLLIVTTDVLLAGISSEAAKSIAPHLQVSVLDNWFFMASSVFLLILVGALITDNYLEPRLSPWTSQQHLLEPLTAQQQKGLKIAGLTALCYLVIIGLLVIPPSGILRDPQSGSLIPSPFIKGIIPLIIFFLLLTAISYGMVTEKINQLADIPKLLTQAMREMAGFIVMVFPLAQFVAMFSWSNMGKFLAISFTDLFSHYSVHGLPAFIILALLAGLLCLFIASGSAIWSILAPVFVPTFILMGYHPAFAQIIFRIADSSVLPLGIASPFLPLFLGFLQRYWPDAKLGHYFSLILPYSAAFFISWLLLLVIWYWLGLPIGPHIYPKINH